MNETPYNGNVLSFYEYSFSIDSKALDFLSTFLWNFLYFFAVSSFVTKSLHFERGTASSSIFYNQAHFQAQKALFFVEKFISYSRKQLVSYYRRSIRV